MSTEPPVPAPPAARWRRTRSMMTRGGPNVDAGSVVGTLALNGIALVANLATTLVLTHMIGPTGYGTFAFALAAAGLLGVPAVLGLAPLVVRNVATYQVRESWGQLRGVIRRAHQAVIASSVILVAVAAFGGLALRIVRPSVVDAYWIGLALVPLTALATVRQAVIQGLGRVVRARVPETVLLPLLFLVLAAGFGIEMRLTGTWAVALYVVATVAAFAVGWILLQRTLPAPARRARSSYDTRVWARSALPLVLLTGIQLLNDQADILLLGSIKGPAAAGVFSVADRTASFVAFFLLAATYVTAPVIARLWERRDMTELQRLVTRTSRLVFGSSLVIAAVLIVFARPVLDLFGTAFGSGRSALIVLSVAQLVNTGVGIVGIVLMMTGHEADATRSIAVGAAAGITLTAVLIPPFGLVGAAVGSGTGVVLTNLVLLSRVRRRTGIWAAAIGRRSTGGGLGRPAVDGHD